jgi:hypothetical protein
MRVLAMPGDEAVESKPGKGSVGHPSGLSIRIQVDLNGIVKCSGGVVDALSLALCAYIVPGRKLVLTWGPRSFAMMLYVP